MVKTNCCYSLAYAKGLLLLLVATYFQTSYCLALNSTTDQSTLLVLKSHIVSDPYQILSENWTDSSSPCSWIGVTCGSRRHRDRVTALDISGMSLSGTIPPQIGNLSFLVSLNLGDNLFSGVIPQQLSLLRRLKFLSLQNNGFTGFVPNSLSNLSNIQVVDLSTNYLKGNIPRDLGKLQNLQALAIQDNHLSGDIPSTVFNLSNLEILAFMGNELSGGLPSDMCVKLPLLRGIYLSQNKLTGEIPSTLSQCSQLRTVYLTSNSISGHIPKEIGKLKFLRNVGLGGNNLNGVIPEGIGNLQNLVVFGIERNSITGALPLGGLPREFGKLHQLEELLLQFNTLAGLIPSELFNMTNLRILALGANGFFGDLPTNLCSSLPALEQLYLSLGYMTGPIPESVGNCSKLKNLELNSNKFTGIVPQSLGNLRLLETLGLFDNNLTTESFSSELSFISSLTNCRSLNRLAFGDNPLDGVIPPSVGNLSSSLRMLHASNCKIKGVFPTEIGNLSNLVIVSLGGNELSGNIPITVGYLHKLQGLYLSRNNIRGSITEGLCDLQSLFELYLSRNELSGRIPECLGNLTSLRSLVLHSNMLTSSIPSSVWRNKDLLELDLSSNFLSGSLPPEIGNLVKATLIDLTMNRLSNSIPTTVGNLISLTDLSFAHNGLEGSIPISMGSMASLVNLDLSYNNLSGSIPKSLEALQYLDYFNISFNAFRGEIPTGGRFGNFTMESFKGNEGLCGIPRFRLPLCRSISKNNSRMKRARFALFILSGVVVFVMLVSLAFILFVRYRRKGRAVTGIDGTVAIVPQRISYYELLQATERFNETNLLGVGSFGSVYKGVLRDGKVLAVKVFNLMSSEAASKSFDVECEVLRNIRHRNLVKVVSSCANEDFKALVLEYMPKGNLDKWLYCHNYCLDLTQRLNIIIDVASALEYLHHGYLTPIVHCDLKPNNVLLDEEMVARVCDFGIAKLLGDGESTVHTDTLATMGYIAPEYGSEGLVSTKCDVYSYGVMVMETFTRKKPSDDMFVRGLSLKSWVQNSVVRESSSEVIDPNLLNPENQHFEKQLQCVSLILELALKCSAESPGDRINMKEAVAELKKIKGRFSRIMPFNDA
ncbi:hypothetical protein ABFX02_11G060500 [Erythranthe guttata]